MLMLGFEPKTFALSAQRSTKLSYTSFVACDVEGAHRTKTQTEYSQSREVGTTSWADVW